MIARFFCFLFFCFCYLSLFCWGFKGHKHINKKSILFMPQELSVFYKVHSNFYIEHSVDPDKRKRFMKNEGMKHYINLDVYDTFPFLSVPRKYNKAVEKYGEEEVKKNGILPWNLEKVIYQLTEAFKKKDGDRILKLSADLGHYVGDAAVPLHITKNYNGQLTNQEGIHGLWESASLNLIDLDTLSFAIKPLHYIDNYSEEIWALILSSYEFVDYILGSETKLSENIAEDEKYKIHILKGNLKKSYSKKFVSQFLAINQSNIQQRLYEGSYLLACIIYTAWMNAGQPDMRKVGSNKNNFEPIDDITEDEVDH